MIWITHSFSLSRRALLVSEVPSLINDVLAFAIDHHTDVRNERITFEERGWGCETRSQAVLRPRVRVIQVLSGVFVGGVEKAKAVGAAAFHWLKEFWNFSQSAWAWQLIVRLQVSLPFE